LLVRLKRSYRLWMPRCHGRTGGALEQDATGQTVNKEEEDVAFFCTAGASLDTMHACSGTRHTGGGR